jgi:hypothetical protein
MTTKTSQSKLSLKIKIKKAFQLYIKLTQKVTILLKKKGRGKNF